MNSVISGISLGLAIFFALIFEGFIPPIYVFHGAHILFVPMLFCYGALILPGWGMLVLAVFTGFITDLMYLHVVGGQVEIALGWSIVYFVLFGMLSSGFQPAFARGAWWIHILLSAGGTMLFLTLQYVMISFRRQGIVLNEAVFWRIIGPGIMAAAFSPFLHVLAIWIDNFLPPALRQRKRGYVTR